MLRINCPASYDIGAGNFYIFMYFPSCGNCYLDDYIPNAVFLHSP